MVDMADSLTEKVGREPRYSLPHAADLLGVPTTTIRNWVCGQTAVIVLDHPTLEPVALSFFNLVEAGFLAAYRRKAGVSMQRVRIALERSKAFFKDERPLLRRTFKSDGKNLFYEEDHSLVDMSGTPGQTGWPEVIREYFKRIDYDSFGPTQYWLLGRHRGCIIDPRVEFGEPVTPRSGVRISLIYSRFQAEESMEEIAEDFGLHREEVEEAIRCSNDLLKAA
jgi:uncharacterized protein (DUF433 family)